MIVCGVELTGSDAGQKGLDAGKTCTFTGDEFATYFSERAQQAIMKKPGT